MTAQSENSDGPSTRQSVQNENGASKNIDLSKIIVHSNKSKSQKRHPVAERIIMEIQRNERMARALEPVGEHLLRQLEIHERMRHNLEPFAEGIRRATELQETMRSRLEPFAEGIRRATELQETMRSRLEPMGEAMRRMYELQDTFASRVNSPAFDSFASFRTIEMAKAAQAVGVNSLADFVSVWRSPAVGQFASRLLRDGQFNRELSERVEEFLHEPNATLTVDKSAALAALEETIADAAVGDFSRDAKTTVASLAAAWTKLPSDLRFALLTFVIDLWIVVLTYFVFMPALTPQEPATQQRIREQRKLAAYATRQLGVPTIAYRLCTRDKLAAFAAPRRDAPRIGALEVGQTVEIVQKRRNWSEVIWLDNEGRTRGGWVSTAYLRRL